MRGDRREDVKDALWTAVSQTRVLGGGDDENTSDETTRAHTSEKMERKHTHTRVNTNRYDDDDAILE